MVMLSDVRKGARGGGCEESSIGGRGIDGGTKIGMNAVSVISGGLAKGKEFESVEFEGDFLGDKESAIGELEDG